MQATRLSIAIAIALAAGGWFWLKHFQHRDQAMDIRRLFPIVLTVGILCRLMFAFFTPLLHGPDEVAHFNYIQYLAEHRALPVQEHPWGTTAFDWEYYQPPLYYLLLAPVYALTDSLLHNPGVTILVLRLCSSFLWLLNVWLALILLKRLQITDTLVRSFVMAMVCLLPTYTFVSAMINNDNLLVTMGGALLVLMADRRHSLNHSLTLGLMLGLALLTKQSAAVLVPAIVALSFLEAWNRRVKWSAALLHLGIVLGLAFVLFAPWAVRSWRVYGTLTPEYLGVSPKAWPHMFYGLATALHNLVKTFWSVAGPFNEVGYPFPLVGMVFLLLCLNWRQPETEPTLPTLAQHDPSIQQMQASTAHNSDTVTPPKLAARPDWLNWAANRPFLAACVVALIANVTPVVQYSFLFGMGQGRHLFPLLCPIALFLAARWRSFPVKQLEPYTSGVWITYALSFLVFCMWQFR